MKIEYSCRLCGSKSISPISFEERLGKIYHIVHCSDCELIQTVEHYSEVSPDYVDLVNFEIDENRLWCQNTHKVPAFKQWHFASKKYISDEKPRLLDVGCGTGGFLSFVASNGFMPYGFDASEAQAEYAQKNHPNVRHAKTFDNYSKKLGELNPKFDVITLWDVLEHIRAPSEFLLEASKIIKPGGYIFVSVPNGGAIYWKRKIYSILGKRPDLIPWEHVYYFSNRSLKLCLEKAGFNILKIGNVVCYPRPLSVFEILRRVGFLFFTFYPKASPQIYAWAKLEKHP